MNNKWRDFIISEAEEDLNLYHISNERRKKELEDNPVPFRKKPGDFLELEKKGNKYILDSLHDLTFDMVRAVFTKKYKTPHFIRPQTGEWSFSDYAGGKNVGSSNGINDTQSLNWYKEEIIDKFGDSQVLLDPEAVVHIQPINPKLAKGDETYGKGVMAYYKSKKSGDFSGD